jgi:hypothetical protein
MRKRHAGAVVVEKPDQVRLIGVITDRTIWRSQTP